jgi:outer membrane protein, heavy metal efflux system
MQCASLRATIGAVLVSFTVLSRNARAEPAAKAASALSPNSPNSASQSSGNASSVKALELKEVVTAARSYYPLILAAARELAAAEGNLKSAKGGFDPLWRSSAAWEATGKYPTFRAQTAIEQPTPVWGSTLFAGYRTGLGTFADYDKKALTNDFGEFRAGLRVPLLRDGSIDRRRATITQQELNTAAAEASKEQQELETIRAASLRYWDWVSASVRLRAFKDWLALAQSRDGQLAERVKHGDISELERTENQRTILQRRNVVVLAERDLTLAAYELSLFFRSASETHEPIVPAPEQAPQSLTPEPAKENEVDRNQASEQAVFARRPDLRRAELARERLGVEVTLAENQKLPGVDVTLAASRDFGPSDPGLNKPVFEAIALLDIPLLNRPAQGRLEAAEQERARATLQLKLARDRARVDIRSALISLGVAKERAALAHQEFELAKKLATAELARFDLGESSLLVVNQREQASAEAEVRSIDAAADYQRALANYRFATAAR